MEMEVSKYGNLTKKKYQGHRNRYRIQNLKAV